MHRGLVGIAVRRLATCMVFTVATALSFPSFAGRFAASDATFAPGTARAAPTPSLIVKAAGGIVDVVEYFNSGLGHFFISADPAEIAVLDGGALGGAWKRTGESFPAWDIVGAPAGTVPVCRFFGTDRYRSDGTRIGPNSHFYTADPAECAFVKTAWQSVASDGLSYPAWTFENYAFAVKLPVGGTCPAGTQPLYRTYNNGANGDPGHRYSMRANLLQGMAGWVYEGLVMCLPAGQGATLPAQLAACGEQDCPAGTTLGSGVGLVNVIVDIANSTTAPIDLIVAAGQTFIAIGNLNQDGLALERLQATIAPGITRRFVLQLFCMQDNRSASKTGVSYAPGPITGNAQLLDIASLADGKLGSVADPATVKASTVQFAVWEITNGSGMLTAAERNLLVSLLATAADDVLAQVALSEQFRATLTISP